MNHPLVSVIIVNWNGLDNLRICLPSLFKQTYRRFEVILVDNASADGSVSWVKKTFPQVKEIILPHNYGFAAANNLGYEKSLGEYVLFLNNDTRLDQKAVAELVNVLQADSDIGGAQSKLLLMDQPERLDSIGAFFTLNGFLFHNHFGDIDKPEYDRLIELYTAKGAAMMFKREVLDKVKIDGNVFDPDYFAYFEETDLCHRIWLAGYKIVYAFKSVVFHKMGTTSSKIASEFVQYHSFKNRIRSYLKNLSPGYLLPVMLRLTVFSLFFAIGNIFSRPAVAVAVGRAYIWNWRQLEATLKMRKFTMSQIRRIPDRDFLNRLTVKPGLSYYWDLFKRHG
jgi:hypothetical protein